MHAPNQDANKTKYKNNNYRRDPVVEAPRGAAEPLRERSIRRALCRSLQRASEVRGVVRKGVEDGLRMAAAVLGMHRRQQGEEQSGRETAAHDEGGHGGRARTAENENLQTFERGDGRRHLSHRVASHEMAT